MQYKKISTKELKILRNNTDSFSVLKKVEDELLSRGKIRKSSFDFFENLGCKIDKKQRRQ